ncbi:MAG: hypothetical protein Q4D30_07530 [Bacteroidales bacterium]|nr:hypothetical protein [Bacteroidales bacterium]
MSNLDKFKKFQLCKNQMNVISGGQIYCQNTNGSGDFSINGMTLEQALALAELLYGPGHAVCEEVIMP